MILDSFSYIAQKNFFHFNFTEHKAVHRLFLKEKIFNVKFLTMQNYQLVWG